jgi:hypothetical protein
MDPVPPSTLVHLMELVHSIYPPPQLQENCSFENNISRVLGELGFNREFIPNGPERPALSRKQYPQKLFGNPSKTLENGEQIRKRGGIPVNLKQFSTATPGKLGKRAVKEDMSCIFRDMIEGTVAIRIPMMQLNLHIQRKSVPGQLPDEDSHF